METLRKDPAPHGLRSPSPRAPRFEPLRLGALTVRMAEEPRDLERALRLERQALADIPAGGLAEPTAIPFCDFLMALGAEGALLGVWRLLPHGPGGLRHGLPGADREAGAGRAFPGSAALLTAIRYTRQGVLEAGAMAVAPGADPETVGRALWSGLVRHMSDLGYGFVLGRERAAERDPGGLAALLPALRDDHGLPPDLEEGQGPGLGADWVRTGGPRAREGGPETPGGAASGIPASARMALSALPAGLKEGLRRGCRLAGASVPDAAPGSLEFVWVASRDMLEAESRDCRASL